MDRVKKYYVLRVGYENRHDDNVICNSMTDAKRALDRIKVMAREHGEYYVGHAIIYGFTQEELQGKDYTMTETVRKKINNDRREKTTC